MAVTLPLDVVRSMTIAMSDALTWNTVVGKQYVRVLEADNGYDRQLDMYLFAFAVRAVLRAESFARSLAEDAGLTDRVDRLRLARLRFDQLVPDAVQVRDILEHFDDYRQGKGRLQKGTSVTDLIEWVEHDGAGRHVLVLAARYRLSIDDGKAACDYLTHEVVEAMRVVS